MVTADPRDRCKVSDSRGFRPGSCPREGLLWTDFRRTEGDFEPILGRKDEADE